ncbi:hypothetical protein FVEG_02616 [Fusarium verticillioides 7600]|uniref:Uncharacterized protein n=1 Tax=Gibberella moniliformis (strain M3125 / FGSC 7600) TaxID=334819 RepID=W7LNF7_GIBM7|nr:hypothetical protein FVEG_02616 [Fusarium verticillioides 7600]XP_018746238.1 hypothetical protein FVEG_02616 [Fusarium verticillioides 7600]EWG40046.1 hypothetical protein FVEG_02616 [Fusarium verticillioides 7600]EWG40047.1 hypothetical protein FVEG_02616 [Fusarium verticillioides 7600]
MDLPELDLQGAPIRSPDCCLSLSYKLFRNLVNAIPNTTLSLDHAKRETPTVLSIGSGSGLLEALFLDYINSHRQRGSFGHAMVSIEGVEVQQLGMREHVNSYLPEQAIHTVRGSWDVTSRLQDSDVSALMFVYPRQPALISQYIKVIAEQDLKVEAIVWLGPMVDWEVFEPCFNTGHESCQFVVVGTKHGSEAGLDEYESMAVARRTDCNSMKDAYKAG